MGIRNYFHSDCKAVKTLRKIAAGSVLLLCCTGACWSDVPADAATRVQDYKSEVVVQAMYLDDGGNLMVDLEERDGDCPIRSWSKGQGWHTESHTFHGTGDYWTEDYWTFCDDCEVGDVLAVTVHRNGTISKSDDYLTCDGYEGYIIPSNSWEVE